MENYILYLEYLNRKLSKFFEQQKPYICCKKGCSKCCQQGDYPFKQIEVEYLLSGFAGLSEEKKLIIYEKIHKLKELKAQHKGEEFLYECPFLIDNTCSVYDYRGVICRTFGLISHRDENTPKIPFCAFEGLNYSNVLDPEDKTISAEKFEKLNIDQEPLAYNVSYKTVTSEKYEEVFGFKFGEMRSLIDWFNA